MIKRQTARVCPPLLRAAVLCFLTAALGCNDRTPSAAPSTAGHRGACEALTQKLNGTRWQYAEGTRGITGVAFTLNADGSITHTDPTSIWHWSAIDAHRIVLIYNDGFCDTITFNDALTEYKQSATNSNPEGWRGKRLTADSDAK